MKKRDYSAASKKAWRTRKRMALARRGDPPGITYGVDLETSLLQKQEIPGYMRRWLPCPNFGEKLK